MHDDATALRRFAEEHDEAAFAGVVNRYLGLVYSAALRQLNGDAHLARDVAQGVFTDLARKAADLARRQTPLAGWLYTSTHHAAAHAVRTEQRRRRREQEAQAMHELSDESARDVAWAQVRPHLDAMMQRLSREDREALVQRYFAGRSFSEIASLLDMTESGARMRVDRALVRLRDLLERRGIRSTMTALGAVLATEAVAAPPAGMAATVASAALIKASAAAAVGLGLLGMTKIQPTIVAAAAAVGLTAVGVEYHAQHRARAELDALRASVPAGNLNDQPASVTAVVAPTAPAASEPERLAGLRREKSALEQQLAQARARGDGAPDTPARAISDGPAPQKTAGFDGLLADVKELHVMPKALKQVAPMYPADMKGNSVQGEVLISFVVTETGDVVDFQPEEATHPSFALAAMDAVSQWKFAPGELNGAPVNVRLTQPLRFAIQDDGWF